MYSLLGFYLAGAIFSVDKLIQNECLRTVIARFKYLLLEDADEICYEEKRL